MNFLAKDFYMAASKARRRGITRKVTVKKGDETTSLTLNPNISKEELKQELEQAEELYDKLEGKFTKKKLSKIRTKIDSLKKQVNKSEKVDDFIEMDGMIVSPPLFEDLHESLNELDKQFNIPNPSELNIPDELKEPTIEEKPIIKPKSIKSCLLNLPPPPKTLLKK